MKFGLLGKSLRHSFSKKYFTQKFRDLRLQHSYENFEIETIEHIPSLLREQPDLQGLNVTIPYKEAILPYLSSITEEAQKIGAVNTVRIKGGKMLGFNTDAYGFEESLSPMLRPFHNHALILGSGGASKAVAYVLEKLAISFEIVSRTPGNYQISYDAAALLLADHYLIVNTTPAGMFPHLQESPPLSLELVTKNHLFYDLIYNPAETLLLKRAKERGAQVKNGEEMLQLQAERSWEIWNDREY